MKALILHQPYATLVSLGVKQWETRGAPPNGSMRPAGVRGMPGLRIEPGERIAIAAATMKPADGTEVGEWAVESWRDEPAERCLVHADDRSGRRRVYLLPLGRMVCTAVVAEALPIVDGALGWQLDADTPHRAILVDGHMMPSLAVVDELSPHADWDISDQLPYGDWRPGRWAWRLTDAEPVQSRPAPEVTRGNRQGVCEIKETW